ncbi:RNA polymerase sigma factor [Agrobacterium sp. Ap1]|uniref:RNA polymerase sigma factor n=1 Tax=Agrobacterium sp. Ap1 TaxID=2815337 RepID=UPI001A8D77D2|nr:RNA polymerase sigma factor [Agrobacterium sp. Ap1]MBO0142054.1 RNA polymerase sigma factor [Agrobacterium sp. Ap1]
MSPSPDLPNSERVTGGETEDLAPVAFEARILALLPQLRRYSRSLTRSDTESEDLLQDCVEKALVSRSQWRGTNFKAWAYRIMTNLHLNAHRFRTRHPSATIDGSEIDDLAMTSADPLESRRLMQSLASLPAEFRVVLTLVVVEGYAYQEVAEMLDIPIGTVMSRLSRARHALREKMREANIIPLRRPR